MDNKVDKVFLDLETNGLNNIVYNNDGSIKSIGAVDNKLIQVGIILVNKNNEVVSCLESSVRLNYEDIVGATPFCKKVHTETGLYDNCLASEKTLSQVEDTVIEFLESHGVDKKIVLAGNSIQFDCDFIKHQLPNLAKKLSHQINDVSTLRAFYEGRNVEVDKALNKQKESNYDHTALNDIACSLGMYKVYNKMATEGCDNVTPDDVFVMHEEIFSEVESFRVNERLSNGSSPINLSIGDFSMSTVMENDKVMRNLDFSLELDKETVVYVVLKSHDCDVTKSTSFMKVDDSIEVEVSLLKESNNDGLIKFLFCNHLDGKSLFPESRKNQIIRLGNKLAGEYKRSGEESIFNAKIQNSLVPDLFKSFLNGNALNNRIEANFRRDISDLLPKNKRTSILKQ